MSFIKKPAPSASRSEKEAYVKAWAAITISVFAFLLAINGYYGGSNSSRVLGKTIEANNLWAWYQAKKQPYEDLKAQWESKVRASVGRFNGNGQVNAGYDNTYSEDWPNTPVGNYGPL